MTGDNFSPNLDTLERFSFETQRFDKPWGHEVLWALAGQYCGKTLFIRAGEALSLQFHRVKDEAWLIHSGRAKIEMGNPGDKTPNTEVVGPGAAFHFPPGTVHRIRALEDTTILEVSTPHLEDVVRLEDNYGRIEP